MDYHIKPPFFQFSKAFILILNFLSFTGAKNKIEKPGLLHNVLPAESGRGKPALPEAKPAAQFRQIYQIVACELRELQ
jgi:hypothetical protein